ncbi:hypothetical protein [Lactobacillus delbrueckii]|uniref:hypothetical protein n=1 Tax=Lactobacillus delbrueckii TaxID=1584 RepID=UPI001F3362B2|nr:hypothetical protein [Lactobacillus delbrueckii]MDK8262147.1 hypothetical protein [Lactobacillus delbrueckii]GHN16437.1 hypothetical protein ME782_08980 [Lactobacillus delbrueckii]
MLLYSTMLNVNNTLTKEKFIQLVIKWNQKSQREEREQAEKEMEQVHSEFDDELKTLPERINRLTQKNEALREENAGLHSKFGEMDKRLALVMGDEEDLYPGEIKELVLSVLADELERGVAKHSRRSDVFSDLIEKNNYQGVYRKKKAEIQRILKNYIITVPRHGKCCRISALGSRKTASTTG